MSSGEGGIIGLQHGKQGGVVLKEREGKQIVSQYFRPHNPQTARQMEVRGINTELSRSYRDDLNQGQRTAWSQRAEMIPGLRGETLYIRQNFQLLDFGLERQITPPPQVMPPELVDLTLQPTETEFIVLVPEMEPGTITAQTPFLDIEIAGGFTSVSIDGVETYVIEAQSEALSQGRVHQNSDFRHLIYADDRPIITPPAGESEIRVYIPAGATRNVVLRIRRFNKYGNVSGIRIFDGITFNAG